MNSYFKTFIRDAEEIAHEHLIKWNRPLGSDGIANPGEGWNLTEMVGASPPPLTWLNDFGTDRKTVDLLNSVPPPGPVRKYDKRPLSPEWQDLIKACVIDQLLVRKTTPPHVVCNVVRPLRVIATCTAIDEPWAITVDDVKFSIEIARRIQPSGKLADLIYGVVRNVLDPSHLTDAGPLSPGLQRAAKGHARKSKFAKSLDELRTDLQERKHAEKLPEKRAFWELVRIVFTETPRTFLDVLRFSQTRTLILTGLRDGECTTLPADWKRYREYVDTNRRPAGEVGGISRSLMLRHFAEKQRIAYEDSTALFEATQFVPIMFEEILTETLDRVVKLTEPLRKSLREQVSTGRILPQFERTDLVRAVELYTYLTGNPFFTTMADEDRQRYVSKYQIDYAPAALDELRRDQLEVLGRDCKLDPTTYVFLNRFKGAPYRDARGVPWEGRKSWSEIYLRVGEVEEFLASELPTKRSDSTAIKLNDGELGAWELLFLMPKRALGDVKEGGLCDITRYCAVGRMDRQMITHYLSTGKAQTLFATYGKTEEDRQLTLRPHSLRHLQNTELFRLGVADTIITKRFNRRSVAQSYEYDHRSLAEELEQVDLKPEVELRLGEKSATVARLIKTNKVRGPVVAAFKKIQQSQGEDAAIEYLSAEADGFHSTPYGHCVNSFLVDPCVKHLECFTGCRHLSANDLAETRQNLIQLEANLSRGVNVLEERKQRLLGGPLTLGEVSVAEDGTIVRAPSQAIEKRLTSGIGLENQLSHAKVRLDGVRKLLATPPGEQVFPAGPDLSVPSNKSGSVLDDIL